MIKAISHWREDPIGWGGGRKDEEMGLSWHPGSLVWDQHCGGVSDNCCLWHLGQHRSKQNKVPQQALTKKTLFGIGLNNLIYLMFLTRNELILKLKTSWWSVRLLDLIIPAEILEVLTSRIGGMSKPRNFLTFVGLSFFVGTPEDPLLSRFQSSLVLAGNWLMLLWTDDSASVRWCLRCLSTEQNV